MTVPSVSEEIAHLLYVELFNLYLHITIVRLAISCQSTDKILPRSRFILMSGSKKLSLLMKQGTSRSFVLIVQSFSRSFCNQLNSFLRFKNCSNTLRVCNGILQVPSIHPQSDSVSDGDLERSARGHHQRVRMLPTQSCSTNHVHSRDAATGSRTSSSCVQSTVGTNLAPLVSVSLLGSYLVCEWCICIPPDTVELTRKRVVRGRQEHWSVRMWMW